MKKRSLFLIAVLSFTGCFVNAQVAINTDGSNADPSAMLEVKSDTAGILIPRMTASQRDAITSPATGLMVYVTGDNTFYFYGGSGWQKVGSSASGWTVSGNYVYLLNDSVGIGTSTPGAPLEVAGHIWQTSTGNSVFLGESAGAGDDLSTNRNVFVGYQSGYQNTSGYNNTALGYQSLSSNKANIGSLAIGYGAMYFADDRTTGTFTWNTAIGYEALRGSTIAGNNTGRYNTSLGSQSLYSNTSGEGNTATGSFCLYSNASGDRNTASGYYSLNANKANRRSVAFGYGAMRFADDRTTGRITYNTAIGYEAIRGSTTASNNTGQYNTSLGYQSLLSNTEGNSNTASGYQSLYANTGGNSIAAYGSFSLASNTTGSYNTASGKSSLYFNTTGNRNTALGYQCLSSNKANSGSVAVGYKAMYFADNRTTGRDTYNTAIGYEALYGSTTVSNNTGRYNSSLGYQNLYSNTSGDKNTASGYLSLRSNTTGNNNVALGDSAGYSNNGDGNVFIGSQAGASLTSANDKLYIDNDDNATPLIYGDFSSRRVGLGTTTPQSKLEIISATGVDGLRVRIGTATKLRVHANGSVSVGTSSEGPVNGLESLGNIEPNTHKGADLGANGKAWDDIYYDDLHNQGASAFEGRNTLKEIILFPPKPKQAGAFDHKTETGDVELDPKSMPPGLSDENSLLTDEISSYNYKTNYEQQLLINRQNTEIEQLTEENKTLKNRLEKLESRVNRMLKK